MTPEEIRNKLSEINKEQKEIYPYVLRNIKLKSMKSELQCSCPHKNSYLHHTESDSYEGRTYGRIMCHDCSKIWEERIYIGKCNYAQWKVGDKW